MNFIVIQNYISFLKREGYTDEEIKRILNNDYGYDKEYVEKFFRSE